MDAPLFTCLTICWRSTSHRVSEELSLNAGVTLSQSWLPLETQIGASGFLWCDKDFRKFPEVDRNSVETQLEFAQWLMLPSGMAPMFSHCSTMVLRSLPICRISLVVCPSGINFGQCDASRNDLQPLASIRLEWTYPNSKTQHIYMCMSLSPLMDTFNSSIIIMTTNLVRAWYYCIY